MPANIAEGRNGVHRAFYAGTPAWHGLGTVVANAQKWEHAMKLAQLNYTLELVPSFVKTGKGFAEVPETKFIRRKDTGDVFAPVSNVYQLIQNIEVGEAINALVRAKEAAFVAAGALGKGERVWAVLELSKVKGLSVKGDPSKLDGYLFATTRHDGKGALQIGTSIMRVECQNMLNMALARSESQGKLVSIRHAGDTAQAIEDAREVLGIVNRFAEEFIVVSNALADAPLPKGYVADFLEKLVPIPEEMERTKGREDARAAIAHLYRESKSLHGVPGSAYRLLQAVVEYADHSRPVRGTDKAAISESRFKSILEGPALDIKQSALDLLKQEFEIVTPATVAAARTN